MTNSLTESFYKLKNYCEKEAFKGWDPADGLNSEFFQALPLIRTNKYARLAWFQLFKRNPINLRKIFIIKKGLNPKGLGLFLSAYCNLYKLNPHPELLSRIEQLAEKLLNLKSEGFSGACWGYNFDWQSLAFFQPKYNPTIVASTFIGYSLLDAYDITRDRRLLHTAYSISEFILKDLNRTYDSDGDFAFSYSPDDNSQVLNASLMGTRMLSRLHSYKPNNEFVELAGKSAAFCCKFQKEDGSWPYGTYSFHQWIDNFHTGYNLECLSDYQKYTGDSTFNRYIERGLNYYLNTFFTSKGQYKYYNNSLYPIDIHAASQLIITLSRLDALDPNLELVHRVLNWTIKNMQSNKGYFYYQANRFYRNKISYMRWTQAWMFYGMSEYFLKQNILV
jgi:hypothetical protein